MKDYDAEGNYYVIGHLKLITGLSERTIRNYISLGLLNGEKINGVWHFTAEEIERFITDPAIRPSILAKNNALVYDFLLDSKKKSEECCIILDLKGRDRRSVAEFFCYEISNGDFSNINFSFDAAKRQEEPRVILKGNVDDVIGLVNKFYSIK